MYIYYEDRDANKAIQIVKKGIALSEKFDNIARKFEFYILLGSNYRKLGIRSLAMENYQQAMLITLENDYETAWSRISIGNFFFDNENNEKALKLYKEAEELFKKYENDNVLQFTQGTSVALNNIGLCYWAMGDSGKVLPCYMKAFELRKGLRLYYEMSHSALMIGNYYKNIGKSDSAIYYYDLGLEYGILDSEKTFSINIHLKKAELFSELEQYSLALAECTSAEKTVLSEGKKRLLPKIYYTYSKIYSQQEDYQKALSYAQKGKQIAEENGDINLQLELLQELISINENMGKIRDAYDHLWEYHELIKEQNISKIEQMQYNFELELSENKIAGLNQDIEQMEKDSTFKITIVAIFSLALIITLVLMYNILRKNKKVHKLLENEKRITERKAALADILKLSVDSNLSYQEFFQKTLEIIHGLQWLPVKNCGAIFVRNANDEFIMMANKNLTENHHIHCQKIKSGECLCGQVIETKKPVIGSQYRTKFEDKNKALTYSHYKLPIALGDEVYGVLNLHQKLNAEVSDIDRDFFNNVCWSLAGIIKNHHLTEKLEKRKKELDTLNQKLFANSLEVDQQNIDIRYMNEELNRQKEELKKANATKNKFFNIIAHDLKNPFNSILGYSRLLIENIDKFEKDQIATFVEEIRDSSETTYKLLENLLHWARAQQDKIPFKPEEVELYILVYETVMLLNPQAKTKNIEIVESVHKDILIHADPEMIKTVIRNLVSNAIKYTRKDGTITVAANQKKSEVIVSVADNGTGMSDKIRQSLFNIGEVKSKEGTEGETGTGFGLMISKEFVEKHGGSIWVESEEGKGSTFYFSLNVIT
jgi:signal transduction histidine kinase/tetratricopeptide (TPR) repeat protein